MAYVRVDSDFSKLLPMKFLPIKADIPLNLCLQVLATLEIFPGHEGVLLMQIGSLK